MSIYPWSRDNSLPTPPQLLERTLIPRVVRTGDLVPIIDADKLAEDLKISAQGEGSILENLVEAAQLWCEAWTGRSFSERQLSAWYDFAPPNGELELPGAPVTSIDAVTFFAMDDTESTFEPTSYIADLVGSPARIILRAGSVWPSSLRNAMALRVDYTAGYAADQVPKALQQVVSRLAAEAYLSTGRELMSGTGFDFASVAGPDVLLLLQPFKVVR